MYIWGLTSLGSDDLLNFHSDQVNILQLVGSFTPLMWTQEGPEIQNDIISNFSGGQWLRFLALDAGYWFKLTNSGNQIYLSITLKEGPKKKEKENMRKLTNVFTSLVGEIMSIYSFSFSNIL